MTWNLSYSDEYQLYEFEDYYIEIFKFRNKWTALAKLKSVSHLFNYDDVIFDTLPKEEKDNWYIELDEKDYQNYNANELLDIIIKEIIYEFYSDKYKEKYDLHIKYDLPIDTMIIKQIKNKRKQYKPSKRSSLHTAWSRLVKNRDQKCIKCNSKDELHAHHINSYKDFPELRYDINNGITLCKICHLQTHSSSLRANSLVYPITQK